MAKDVKKLGWENHSWHLLYYIQAQPSLRPECMHASAKNAQEISLDISLSYLRSLSYHLPNHAPGAMSASCTLGFEGEGGADLVGSLVELLGIE